MKKLKALLRESYRGWKKDDALSEGAALSFYTLVAFPALLISLLSFLSLFLHRETVQTEILRQANIVMGDRGTDVVQQVFSSLPPQTELKMVTFVSFAILLVGAAGFFGQLQKALNKIWDVKMKNNLGIKKYLLNRGLHFIMVLGLGGFLIGTILIEAFISFALPFLQNLLPIPLSFLQVLSYVLAFIFIVIAFALIFKFLPSIEIQWKDVWMGAIITALLFTLGKFLIGLYLSNSRVSSAYGAAGSLVAFLVWIYYSSQVIFFGAEITQAYSHLYGSGIRPDKNARSLIPWWKRMFNKT